MKVLLCDPVDESIEAHFNNDSEVEFLQTHNRDELLDALPGAHVLVVRSGTTVDREVLDKGDHLRAVVRAGVGLDNIDLDYADECGVSVENTPEASSNAVAELVVTLVLSVYREVPRVDAELKQGNWAKSSVEGYEIKGKTVGIVGFGRIGRRVGELMAGFGADLQAFDEYIPDNKIRSGGAEPRTLPNLLETSDIVTVHVPLTDETRHLISSEELQLLSDQAVVINCARGGIIDETALQQALEDDQLLGAGLDTFESESPGATPLVQHPRVVTTPHIGATTNECQARIAQLVIDHIEDQRN